MKNAMTVLGLQDFEVSEQETIEALLSARLQDLRSGSFGDSGLDIDELGLCISSYSASVPDNHRIELARALVGKYESHPLFVLLSKEYEGDSRYASKYDSIVTKTVQLALALAEMGPEYADDIYVVCRRVWLLQKKDESEFLRRICSFEQPLKKIRKKLLAISNVDHEQITELRDVIEEWCSVIQRLLLSKPKQKRPKPGDVLSLDPDVVSHDDIGENGATLSLVSPADEGIYPTSDREIQHDRSPQGQLTRVQDESSSADRSDGMIALRGLEVLNGLQMQYATPPCYYARLTDGEIQGAFDFCLKKLDRSPAYLILLLSMIYGRSVERLSKIKRRQSSSNSDCGDFWAIGKETTGLGYNPDLPRHSGFGLIDSKAHNGLLLPLPPAIGSSLRHLLATNDGRLPSIDVTEAIRTLRKKVSSRITALRLQLSLRASLLSLGTDEAIVGLLAGVAAKHCAALYYVHTSESSVHQAYFDYLDMRLPKRLTKRWPLPSRHVGSRLRVPAELVSTLFSSQATRISAARKGAQIDSLEYHNELVIYTWQVMALVSGSRAVTEPFGTLSNLDLTSGTLRLADKNNRREGAYRTIALCDLASRQINQYLQNLQYLASTVDDTNPELSTYIGRVLDGQEPWLFLIRGRNAIALRPKEIQRIVWHRWRAPLNWTRHFLRSWFLEKGTSRGVARAFMGHADMGAAPQSRFDATSMFELKQLARQIDELLLSLNIPVVKAWNTHS